MTNFTIKTTSNILKQGGVIAYPTEAVYGLGCDPNNEFAIERLLRIKNRPAQKGLILVAAEFDQLGPFISDIPQQVFDKIMKSWPGPINWLLPANPAASVYLRGTHTLQAVRISGHPCIRAICQQFGGAIISTSANVSNQPPAKNALQVRLRFNKKIDYIINAPLGEEKQPCEIKNAISDQIIR